MSLTPALCLLGHNLLSSVIPVCDATLTGAAGHLSWEVFPFYVRSYGRAQLRGWAGVHLSPQLSGQWDYLVEMVMYPCRLPVPNTGAVNLQETSSFCP